MKPLVCVVEPRIGPMTIVGQAIFDLVTYIHEARASGDWHAETRLTLALEALLDVPEAPSELPTQPALEQPITGVRLKAELQEEWRKAR